MSQFVKKSVSGTVRVSNVSSGSKSCASPYELACVKGVRNTSFVPAEDEAAERKKERMRERQIRIKKQLEKDNEMEKEKKEMEKKKKEKEEKKKKRKKTKKKLKGKMFNLATTKLEDDNEIDKLKKIIEKNEEKTTITIQGSAYTSEGLPTMIPIGNADMINKNENHHIVTFSSNANIVVIGSGWHKAMEFLPILQGVTPDIKGEFNAEDPEGKVVFATLKEVCDSVDKATSLEIRKDPLAKATDPEKKARLLVYKKNFKAWVTSLAPNDAMETTHITFLRNIYPKDNNGQYVPTNVKPSWVVGLGVDAALDCGSGKVALVDGTTGAQLGNNKKWKTDEKDARWTIEDIETNAEMCSTLCGDREATVAYGTGNWRKEHMESTFGPFKDALAKKKIDFKLLSGELEAKYGGISSLKCTVPYDKTTKEWVVIELGGGSTQISRFSKDDTE